VILDADLTKPTDKTQTQNWAIDQSEICKTTKISNQLRPPPLDDKRTNIWSKDILTALLIKKKVAENQSKHMDPNYRIPP
jgi:hypothetical protein